MSYFKMIYDIFSKKDAFWKDVSLWNYRRNEIVQYFGITEVCIGFQSFENAFVAAKLHLIKTTLRNLN